VLEKCLFRDMFEEQDSIFSQNYFYGFFGGPMMEEVYKPSGIMLVALRMALRYGYSLWLTSKHI